MRVTTMRRVRKPSQTPGDAAGIATHHCSACTTLTTVTRPAWMPTM